jgi:hypothetical protein
MSDQEPRATYLERTNKAYYVVVDAIAWSNYRFLDYWKRVWEINARAHASTVIDAYLRESLDRAQEVLQLTIDELAAQAQKSAELSEKLTSQSSPVQQAALKAYRALLESSLSNLNVVKETTSKQLEEIAKRLDELRSRATS